MKAYLDKPRPPLISRASLSVQDAKFGSQSTARLGGLGIAIPPNAGFELPPDPSEVLPIDPSEIKIKGVSRGVADWPFAQGGLDVPPVDVVFYFIPSENAHYSITAYFAAHGFYILNSDDSWWNSRHAAVSLDISLDVYQFGDRGWKSFPKPIDRYEQNTNEFDNYDRNLSFNEAQDFRQGEPVVVTARIKVNADAYGDGSYAEINLPTAMPITSSRSTSG